MDRIRRQQIDVPRRTALDFGCGIGRTTQALVFHFERVCGLDISPTMIREAERHNRFHRACQYVLNCEPDLSRFKSGSFDFVYSSRTLQYLEPELTLCYVREFIRLLSPHGLAVFQLPSQENTTFRLVAQRRVAASLRPPGSRQSDDPTSRVPMHYVPRARIEQAVLAAGATVVASERDRCVDRRWMSHRYYVGKPRTRRPFSRS